MTEKLKKIGRNAAVMTLATRLSRILGLVRDQINAALFGAGIVSDAFYVAYRIPNMLNSEGHFTVPALAPAIGNLVMIITGIALCPLFSKLPETQVIVWSFGAP